VKAFEDFLTRSPTPWHAAAEAGKQLAQAGFQALDPKSEAWVIQGPGAYVVQGGLLVAWRWPATLTGLRLGSAHTDSPCLRLKPRSTKRSLAGTTLGVEVYGGMLLHTWFDRTLEIAGRVHDKDGRQHLVRLASPRPVLPSLAIHLDREVNERGPQIQRELHLPPLASLGDWDLQAALQQATGVDALGFELCLVDAAPPERAGTGELLQSGRLDNLASCHALLSAFLALESFQGWPVIALFDGEEIGSELAGGARSNTLLHLLERAASTLGAHRTQWLALLSASVGLSADMAHAVHPNHPGKHDLSNAPLLGQGPVLKTNASYRYATDGESAALLRRLAREVEVPLQEFAMRADLGCGSTVGPSLSSAFGMPVVDCGSPLLGMHSARELMAFEDQALSTRLYQAFLAH
jgi:aspartyl aminopeptidase